MRKKMRKGMGRRFREEKIGNGRGVKWEKGKGRVVDERGI